MNSLHRPKTGDPMERTLEMQRLHGSTWISRLLALFLTLTSQVIHSWSPKIFRWWVQSHTRWVSFARNAIYSTEPPVQFKAPDSNRSVSVGTRRFCARLQLHWPVPQMPGGQKTANCGKHPKTALKQETELFEKGLQHQKDGRMGYLIQNFSAIDNPKHWKSNPSYTSRPCSATFEKQWQEDQEVLQCSVESGQLNSITSGDVTSSHG